jgi:molybdate transport system regulatory protein
VAKLSIRIDFENGFRLGPGKIALLERVRKFGSIAAAGRDMDMSYRRAWELVEALNRQFARPIVILKSGGRKGGGASVTEQGQQLIALYKAVGRAAKLAGQSHVKTINRLARKVAKQKRKSVG